jgi:hypothetical protein
MKYYVVDYYYGNPPEVLWVADTKEGAAVYIKNSYDKEYLEIEERPDEHTPSNS